MESNYVSDEGYSQAIALLRACCTQDGYLATPTERDNYRRIWGRDGAITGLAALLTGDGELIDGCRRTLETLARYQGPHGEIPSNVDPKTNRVSYGGTAGRVDADLWFVICCGEYLRVTGDLEFMNRMLESLESVRYLLAAWEFNTRGLIYVPPTGDWADEYVQSGYVLYDQLLYFQAQKEFAAFHREIHESRDHHLADRTNRLKHLIRSNYWFSTNGKIPDDVYHEILYEKGCKAAPSRGGTYWMPFFSPVGYGYRFDAMANALVMLLDIANEAQCEKVDAYIAQCIVREEVMLLPAFDPVITPKDEAWDDLQMTFSHTFKNAPYEYHNGGLWPLVTSFYAASLVQRGKFEMAQRYLTGIHSANRLERNGREWSFSEYLHGKNYTPQGTGPMAWNAAGAIIVEKMLQGKQLFQ